MSTSTSGMMIHVPFHRKQSVQTPFWWIEICLKSLLKFNDEINFSRSSSSIFPNDLLSCLRTASNHVLCRCCQQFPSNTTILTADNWLSTALSCASSMGHLWNFLAVEQVSVVIMPWLPIFDIVWLLAHGINASKSMWIKKLSIATDLHGSQSLPLSLKVCLLD